MLAVRANVHARPDTVGLDSREARETVLPAYMEAPRSSVRPVEERIERLLHQAARVALEVAHW